MLEEIKQHKEIWQKNPGEPLSLLAMGHKHLQWMQVKNYSQNTIRCRCFYLGFFLSWCDEQGLIMPIEIKKADIDRYQSYLCRLPSSKTDEAISTNTRHRHLSSLRNFFAWLCKKNYLLCNPAGEITLPKLAKKLPRNVLTSSEVEKIINQINIDTLLGKRDRAILETFYSTGIRRQELINLSINDVDLQRGTLLVNQGKGKKDRIVPIGERASKWINKYIIEARPYYNSNNHTILFLTTSGEILNCTSLSNMVGNYVRAAGITKKGACHLFRHSMATSMLENGADIRFIKEILGHSDLSSTEIYTKVSIGKLKQVHSETHPSGAQNQENDPPPVNIKIKIRHDEPTSSSTPNKTPLENLAHFHENQLAILAQKFLHWMEIEGYSKMTIRTNSFLLKYFIHWCQELAITTTKEITRGVIENYQSYLLQLKSKTTGKVLCAGSRSSRLHALILFFHWLTKEKYIEKNPALHVDIPKNPKRLPSRVLTHEEIHRIMLKPDLSTSTGVRDRAMLETLYATAIRRQELAHLTLNDLDLQRGTLLIRESKSNRDRIIPIGERASKWLEIYITDVRPLIAADPQEQTLFLTHYGEGFAKVTSIARIVKEYLIAIGITKGSCHLFRHTAATHMLENGADIRHISEMLGHANLSTTEIYTRVSIGNLKNIHTRTHPAKMNPTKTSEILAEIDDLEN